MMFWIFDFLNIPLPLLCWQKISCKLVFRFRPLNVPAMSFGYKLCKVFPPRGNLFSLHQQRGWMESINREEASKRKPFIMVHIALMLTKRNQMFCFCFKSLLWNDLQPIDWSNINPRQSWSKFGPAVSQKTQTMQPPRHFPWQSVVQGFTLICLSSDCTLYKYKQNQDLFKVCPNKSVS